MCSNMAEAYTQIKPVTFDRMTPSESPDSAMLIAIMWCRSCMPETKTKKLDVVKWLSRTDISDERSHTWLNGHQLSELVFSFHSQRHERIW